MLDLVEQFCVSRGVSAGTRFTIAPNLADALWAVHRKGPDRRWLTVATHGNVTDIPDTARTPSTARVERLIFTVAIQQESTFNTGPVNRPWFLSHTITSVVHWARLSRLLRDARAEGLGWVVPAHKHVLLVPLPRMSMAEGRTDVLHDDSGRRAVEWPDGTGYHFLHGAFFSPELYRRVVGSELSLAELCALPSVDHRSIALSYMTFDDLVTRAGAQLIDRGARGTSLFRLWLPDRIARDRPRGYGECDYFIHMRDASHPEREFVEWVDPRVAIHGDAELCQAHAFGISLQEWLSIEQAG